MEDPAFDAFSNCNTQEKSKNDKLWKLPLTGNSIDDDANIRLERAKFYPKNPALRLLSVSVQITEWLSFYPAPPKKNGDEYREWMEKSNFSAEEKEYGIKPIVIKAFYPIWANALVCHGKDIENQKIEFPAASKPYRWFLIGSSSAKTQRSDAEALAKVIGKQTEHIMNESYQKNAILGAVLFGPPDPAECTSPWRFDVYGEHIWKVYGCIKFRFDENGPSTYFKNIDCNPGNGCSILLQSQGKERVQALRKKLLKFKFFTVRDPGSGTLLVHREHQVKKSRSAKRKSKYVHSEMIHKRSAMNSSPLSSSLLPVDQAPTQALVYPSLLPLPRRPANFRTPHS